VATTFVAGKDQRPVKVFFDDEARFGRINIVGRCWVAKSAHAVVSQQIIREYLYAYTTVCPQTGENYSIISPVNNTETMNIFLEAFAKAYDHYRIIMCLDGAGWHTSKAIVFPENVRFIQLPPYSPELNPIEHIWDYIREQKKFNNYTFNTLDNVEYQLSQALKQLNEEKDILKPLFNFNWLTYSS